MNHQRIVLMVAAGAMLLGAMFIVACPSHEPTGPHDWNESKWGTIVPHTSFPGDCSLCHITDGWDVIKANFTFDHEKETGYALNGAHATASCLRCHNDRGPVELFIEHGCAGCHVDPHESELGTDCAACHTEVSWQPSGLIMEHQQTRFPLYGAHIGAPCAACHHQADVGVFTGAPVECEACHASQAASVENPDHTSLGWLDNCEECHAPTSWAAAHFHHDAFPLTGRHAQTACLACHTSGDFADPLPTDCYSCHTDDYTTASSPDHTGFSTECKDCHSTSGWSPAKFHHDVFPLTGQHKQTACLACHTSGNFSDPLPTDCYSCHTDDYTNASTDHSGFGTECQQCHSTSAWTPANFNHTWFPLRGHHNLTCSKCHTTPGDNTVFSCTTGCHGKSSTDSHHHDVNHYVYDDDECYSCHRNGKAD